MRNLYQLFDWQYIGQIIGGDFAKFCGLLRTYELYLIYHNSPKIMIISHFFSIADKRGNTRSIKIRADTKYEEIIGIKREWIHPLRDSISKCNLSPAYYDLAILELGKKCCKSGISILNYFQTLIAQTSAHYQYCLIISYEV